MTRVLGIDFSGAKDAGRKIWVAEGNSIGRGTFKLERLSPAIELPGGGIAPEMAIPALANHIANQGEARIGCDFPFGLPKALVADKNWSAFALRYETRFPDPDSFRRSLMRRTRKQEHKRQTDRIARTPFNSYNLRLYRQTWWGIAGVLRPLVAARSVIVCPQQRPKPGLPLVMEVCAACTLKSIDLYPSYKGPGPARAEARCRILDTLIECQYMAAPTGTLRRKLLENQGGDALDAAIGAIAVARADLSATPNSFERLEGRVYFEL